MKKTSGRTHFLGGLICVLCVVTGVAMWGIFHIVRYISAFETASGVSILEIKRKIETAWNTPIQQSNDKVTVLLLGTDQVVGRGVSTDGSNVLTDSMVNVSLDLKTFTVTQLSLPRDLWIDQYKTKINALYYYGKSKDPKHPTDFSKQVVQEITGIPIQHVVVLNLDTVANIIDDLGGIDVQIDRTFSDEMFPRSGIDVSQVHDPKLLYETVSFTQGVEHMNGERALIFIRSRHSKDLIEGTDEARIQRQQKIIQALISRVINPSLIKNPALMGSLYKLYADEFSKEIPFDQVVAIGRYIGHQYIVDDHQPPILHIKKAAISIAENGHAGVLYHPDPKKFGGQWVYAPVDPTWTALQSEIQEAYAQTK